MSTPSLLRLLTWPGRLFLAYLFLTASLGGWIWTDGKWMRVEGKLADPQLFTMQIRALDLLPDPWNAWLGMALPWLEVVAGVALLLPWTALGGTFLASLLLAAFLTALTSAHLRGLEVTCGCFGGPRAATGDPVHAIILRILWLILALVTLALLGKASTRPTPPHKP